DASLVIECQQKGLQIQAVSEDESYVLTITAKQAKLVAPNPLGILHGLGTLLQLVQPQDDRYLLPSLTIRDRPRFAWRGLLLDTSRHWQPVEVIERNLDGLAAAKMNVLEWHLSDDQGFRVESKKYPKLHQMGSNGHYY